SAMLDLFDAPVLPGLRSVRDFVDAAEERMLIKRIDSTDLISYASSRMKHHHPDVFCAALMNAQPMGFYAPAQIVRDAREHGVEVRPPCIKASRWDCTLEPTNGRYLAVRLGLRVVRGLSNADGAAIVGARSTTVFESVEDVWKRSGVQ
ncbi:hypothetical protein JWE23_19560, partial [Acinetobacter baumannii]|nr:hypothetical protein [Acinetobacter baumannii]